MTQKLINYPVSNCTSLPRSFNSPNQTNLASVLDSNNATTIDAVNATIAVVNKGKFFKSDCHDYTSILVLLFSMAVSRFGKSLSALA